MIYKEHRILFNNPSAQNIAIKAVNLTFILVGKNSTSATS